MWASSPSGCHHLCGFGWFRTCGLWSRCQGKGVDGKLAFIAGQIAKKKGGLQTNKQVTQKLNVKNAFKPTKPLPFKFLTANVLNH